MARKRLNLALQGGGAHGAFTWGVLDRLLREPDIEIEGVSATSAGAMNAAMLTTGMKSGGREEACKRLRDFWRLIRDMHPINQPPFSFWFGVRNGDASFLENHPAYVMADVVTRFFSPYQLNPHAMQPLRDALHRTIDFSKVVRLDPPRLFVCATDVLSGRAKIFSGEEISVEALLASACLPFLFPAVEIRGRPYWDGGYTGNPPIWPLIYECESEDVLVVHINPIEREALPTDARGIQNRVNEIAFNSNLMGEMRAVNTMSDLIASGAVADGAHKQMRMHAVEDFETMKLLSFATKLAPDWEMMKALRDAGRAAMSRWLEAHKDDIGRRGSVDLKARYL